MFISLENGQVLLIFNTANRTIEDVKQEASQRIDNLKIPGKLLDERLNVITSFDSFGKEIKSC